MTDLQKHITTYFGVTKENLDKVTALFLKSELEKGEYFIKSGQHCDKLSFVQSGFIRIYANTNDKEITQWISSKGQFLTDLQGFTFNQRTRWNIKAVTSATLYTIRKHDFDSLNTIIPNWSEIEKKFIAACFLTLEDRVFMHLSLSAEERYNQLFEENRELFQHVPLNYLASMLGMSPETLSRIRRKHIS